MSLTDFRRVKTVLTDAIDALETAAYVSATINSTAAEELLNDITKRFLREYNEFLITISISAAK